MDKLEPYQITCMLGRFNLSSDDEVGSMDILIWDIFIHPRWSFLSQRYESDIAVLVLIDLVKFSSIVRPVCLPPSNYEELSGNGTVIGWGKSETSPFNNHDPTPSKVKIPTVNASYCYSTFPKLAPHTSVGSFCGGYENMKKAPCLGDSGGGFYIKTRCRWFIRGIVSGSLTHKEHGCDINKFQLYTNVARFIEFIKDVMDTKSEVVWNYLDFKCSESRDENSE